MLRVFFSPCLGSYTSSRSPLCAHTCIMPHLTCPFPFSPALQRDNFHGRAVLLPVGFTISRKLPSCVNAGLDAVYVFRVTDGGDFPSYGRPRAPYTRTHTTDRRPAPSLRPYPLPSHLPYLFSPHPYTLSMQRPPVLTTFRNRSYMARPRPCGLTYVLFAHLNVSFQLLVTFATSPVGSTPLYAAFIRH